MPQEDILTRAERALVGCALLGGADAETMAAAVKPEMFSWPAHAEIWRAVTVVTEQFAPVDFLSVEAELGEKINFAGGVDYLVACAEATAAVRNWRHYAKLVTDAWRARVWKERLKEAARLCDAGKPREARAAILKILDGTGDAAQVGYSALETLDMASQQPSAGVETGLEVIDSSPDDFRGAAVGELHVVGAPSGRGKTLLLCQVALHVLRQGGRVVFGTFELPHQKITKRILRMMCGYGDVQAAEKFLDRDPNAVLRFRDAESEFSKFNLVMYDPGGDMTRRKEVGPFVDFVRYQHEEEPVTAFFADYIQRIRSGERNQPKHEEIEDVTLALVGLANSLTCAGFAACQIKPGEDGEMKVRGSQNIEDHVATLMFKLKIKKKGEEPRDALMLQKARHGRQITMFTRMDRSRLLHVEEGEE